MSKMPEILSVDKYALKPQVVILIENFVFNRPLHGFRRHLGCGESRQKLQQMYMEYCSSFNADNFTIVHRILTKKDVF